MKTRLQDLGISAAFLVMAAGLTAAALFAADKPQTFTGKVSDAMCGAKHMMADNPAGCLRACISKGSKYALVVHDKVYTLDTSDQATLDRLNELADKNATVKGTANGDIIEVASVAPGK